MKTIYIVYGETGEYEDWNNWEVVAFTKKHDAEVFAKVLQRQADNWREQLISGKCKDMSYELRNVFMKSIVFLDPDFQYNNDTGTKYGVFELDLRNKL